MGTVQKSFCIWNSLNNNVGFLFVHVYVCCWILHSSVEQFVMSKAEEVILVFTDIFQPHRRRFLPENSDF